MTHPRALDALGDPTRREIVARLASTSETTATDLARDLPITRQAVAKHLATLREAGVVESERHGRESRYRLRPEEIRSAAAWLEDVGARWDRRLGRLRDLAEGGGDEASG